MAVYPLAWCSSPFPTVPGGLQGCLLYHKLPLYWTEPGSDNSKIYLLLDKAEAINGAGGTSVITSLRKGKNCSAQQLEERKYERNSTADTKVREEGMGGGVQGGRAEITLPTIKVTMIQISTLQPMGTPFQSRRMHPERSCGPWKAHTGEQYY